MPRRYLRHLPGFLAATFIAAWLVLPVSAEESTVGAAPQQSVGEDGIIGTDHRRLLSDFTIDGAPDQTAMRTSLAATQRLFCRGSGGSASLVYRSDVIIFSAHEIIEDDGKQIKDLDQCVFVVTRKVGGTDSEERYPILLATLDHGAYISSQADFVRGNQADWAIVRLARPVPEIEPYRLAEPSDIGAPGTAVTTVSILTSNWAGHGSESARLSQSCHIMPVEPELVAAFPGVMHFDCDVGYGSSGGAILEAAASGLPRYIATILAYSGNHCTRAGLETCYSIGRRLDADIEARIKGTSAQRVTLEDSAFEAAQDARLATSRDKVAALAMTALGTGFQAQRDQKGQTVSGLFERIKVLIAAGHDADADPLFFEAYRALHDPDQARPEWPWLLLSNGDSLQLRGRMTDAFFCFQAAYNVAGDALKPYLLIKMARSTNDAQVRRDSLRKAYLSGGDALFQAAKAETELAEIRADGVATSEK